MHKNTTKVLTKKFLVYLLSTRDTPFYLYYLVKKVPIEEEEEDKSTESLI